LATQAQTYKKRVLFFGPSIRDSITGREVSFVNSHAAEFEPVDNTTAGKSAVWDAQQWIDATVADFKQFDVIAISDTARSGNHPALLASRAIWGSAITGNFFVVAGDPVSDGVDLGPPSLIRIFRQGLRFSAAQAGNSHGRTGLYLALDHMTVGQNLNGHTAPTEIPILSWFGSFTAVNLQNNAPLISRLVTANPTINVLGADLSGYNGNTVAQGFHSWPGPFVPVAQRVFNLNATPTNTLFYTAPCEADTGYQLCEGQRPLVYILVKPVNLSELTRLVAAQCNVAVDVGQACNFSAYSTIVPDPNPNSPSGPSTPVSWRVVSGPNAGLHGKCTRQTTPPYGIPTGIWTASYNNQGSVTANNFQDVVQLFLDHNNDEIFNDMLNSADSNDPDDPAPGVTIEYGTTFTVNWSIPTVIPQVSIAKLPSPAAAAEPATDATFRLTRSGTPTASVAVKICVSGTATTDVDYELRVGSIPVPVFSGEAILTIPAGLSSLDVVVHPLDDTLAEGTETVRMALKDVFDFEHTYVVGGQGFAQLDILDDDQPVVTVGGYVTGIEQTGASGAWIFDTGTAITEPVHVYFTLGGTATPEVDYLAALTAAFDDSDPSPAILLPSGVARITILPTSGSPAGPGHHAAFLGMSVFKDSRTEGTESATITLLAHPGYKFTTASGSVNITDDDTPKLPSLGFTITDLGDATHLQTTALGLNNQANPTVAGDFFTPQGNLRAFSWTAGAFTDLPPIPQLGPTATEYLGANAVNDSGWVVGAGRSELSQSIYQHYYFLWNGSSMLQLQTPAGADLDNGPQSINDAGFMVGTARSFSGFFKATWWEPNSGAWNDLGSLSFQQSFLAFCWAIGPSQIGAQPGNRVVGLSQFDLSFSATTPAFHAFRTQPSTSPLTISQFTDDLGNALASETSYSGAYAINALSEIAGYSDFSATESRAAYKDGNSGKHKGWRYLGVLAGGSGAGQSTHAFGINDTGLIVGWSRSSTGQKAVVWENYQSPAATDLNLRIPTADRPNWVLQSALAINNSRRIVGVGLKNGQPRAFLLTPIN
jgi:hypothetical protein